MANISPGVAKSPSDAIKVAVRFRSRKEGSAFYWKPKNDQCVVSKDSKPSDKQYLFDRVFNETENNNIVYHDVGKEVIESAMQGFNSTIFAYGQTASGKTHTMMGPKVGKEDGLIPQGIREIFEHIENSKDKQFLLRVSYIEIYNENVYDLLADEKDRTKDLVIRDDDKGNTNMDELLIEAQISSKDELMDLMNAGEKQRHVGITDMNDRSSRSHTIFRIIIESLEVGIDDSDDTGKAVKVSHLNLVDLAGSERAKQTGAAGQRFKESQNINLSLMNLGRVIALLAESKPAAHIPYRNSKLTRILKNSLGGNAKTLIICTITAAEEDQTKSTLEFASRAKKIVNHAEVNEFLDDRARIKQQKDLIRELQSKIDNYQKDYETSKVKRLEREMQVKSENEKMLQAQVQEKSLNEKIMQEQVKHYEVKLKELQEQLIFSGMNSAYPGKQEQQNKLSAPRQASRRVTIGGPLVLKDARRKSYGGSLGFEIYKKQLLEFKLPIFKSPDAISDTRQKPVTLQKTYDHDDDFVSSTFIVRTASENDEFNNDDSFGEISPSDKTENNVFVENNFAKEVLHENVADILSPDDVELENLPLVKISDGYVTKRPRNRGTHKVRFEDLDKHDDLQEPPKAFNVNLMKKTSLQIYAQNASSIPQDISSNPSPMRIANKCSSVSGTAWKTDKELECVLSSSIVDCYDLKSQVVILQEELKKYSISNISKSKKDVSSSIISDDTFSDTLIAAPDLCSNLQTNAFDNVEILKRTEEKRRQENDELRQKLADYERLENDIKAYKSNLEQKDSEMVAILKQLENVRSVKEKMNLENESLRQQLINHEDLKNDIEALKSNLKGKESKTAELQMELTEIKNVDEKRSAEIDRLKLQVTNYECLKHQVNEYQSNLDQKNSKEAILLKQLENIRNLNERMSLENESLRQQLTDYEGLKNDNEALTLNLKEKESKNAELLMELTEIKNLDEKRSAEIDRLKLQVTNYECLKHQVDDYQSNLSQKNSEEAMLLKQLENIRRLNERMSQENGNVRQQLSNYECLKNDIEALKSNLEEKESKNAELLMELTEIRSSEEKIRLENDSLRQELTNNECLKQDSEIIALSKQLEEIKSLGTKARLENDSLRQQLKNCESLKYELQLEVTKLKSSEEKRNSEIESLRLLQTNYECLKSQLKEYELNLKQKDSETAELFKQLGQIRSSEEKGSLENERLRHQLANYENLKNDIEVLKLNLEVKEFENAKLVMELTEIKSLEDNRIYENDYQRRQLEKLESEKAKLSKQLEKATIMEQKTKLEIEALRLELSNNECLKNEMKNFESNLTRKDSEMVELRKQLEMARSLEEKTRLENDTLRKHISTNEFQKQETSESDPNPEEKERIFNQTLKQKNSEIKKLYNDLKATKSEVSRLFLNKENLKDIRLENDRLRQQLSTSKCFQQEMNQMQASIKEKDMTISRLLKQNQETKTEKKEQINILQHQLLKKESENERGSEEISALRKKISDIEIQSSSNVSDEPRPKISSKEKYDIMMSNFEKGSWQGTGSGIVKEGALDTAKYRIQQLETELTQRKKIEQQLRHERDTYFNAGGKWKTLLKQLEARIVKRGCTSCKNFVSTETNNS